ncbi:MAG: methionine--tRNA ligase [Clostridia bacterium]|nr:methionine--tRNA ligase [Clostridia bacterium]
MNKPKCYLTTAIPYASRKPHIGNTYDIILADCYKRYKQLCGYDVLLSTGTDEHGQKIEEYAAEAKMTPKEYADSVSAQIRQIWDEVGAQYDVFIKTTDAHHEKAAANLFDKFLKQGDIYKSEYEGWYCVPDESFFTDTQVVDGKCPECGRPVIRAKEEAYFFRMSKYADALLKYYDENPDFIIPESRKKEMINNFIKPGLQDLCVTRSSFKWGVPVKNDPKHVLYVWMDALINYITALGYDPENVEQPENFKKYWPADVHFIGKDILRFHSIYWPIFLMAAGLPLPKRIFAHPWLLSGVDKMSKSRGNVIYADDLIKIFGRDGCRYYSLAEMPFSSDGTITYENVISRYNSDLANILGNLVKRTESMTVKYFDGVIPSPGEETELDRDLKDTVVSAVSKYTELMDRFMVSDALEAVFTALRRANKYIDETTPWILAKTDEGRVRLATVLYNLLETIRICTILLKPAIPDSADKILSALNEKGDDINRARIFGGLAAGGRVTEGEALFSRLDEAKIMEELKKPEDEPKPEKPKGEPEIEFDDFVRVEMRTAEILECEPVPKSKKLLKLKLDLGYEQRQVLSGIAQYYTPDKLIGKKVVVVANLKPRMMMGYESKGMVLASSAEGDTVRVIFLDPETPNGQRIS